MLNLFMTFMIMGPGSSPDPNIYYRTKNHSMSEQRVTGKDLVQRKRSL